MTSIKNYTNLEDRFDFPVFEVNSALGSVLLIGDVHLYNKELRSTKKYVANNMFMLNNIYDYLVENTEIKTVIFLGDIQHLTPSGKNTLREAYKWIKFFRKLGDLMKPRFNTELVKVIMGSREDVPFDDFLSALDDGDIYPVFTLKGNHDIDSDSTDVDSFEASKEPYTFYDILIAEGLLVNPEQLVLDDKILINFYNYGEPSRQFETYEGIEYTVGLFHDTLITEDSPSWALEKNSGYDSVTLLNDVDIAYVGHIHEHYPPRLVECENGSKAIVWVVGSMGRTQMAGNPNSSDKSSGQIRDVGFGALIDTQNVSSLDSVRFDVIPSGEYFKLQGREITIEQRKEMRSFTLKRTNESDMIMTADMSPRELILGDDSIEENVKNVCLSILDEINLSN